MKIVADRGKCEGLGMCEAMADQFFEVGEDGVVQVLDETPPEADRQFVDAAVQACPVAALRLQD
ncbi:ferredoxin [Amycolatopsis sp. FU40]|uniref:Ferredoxin n=1 Tax=Amycolatopsis dendrobii TaxID=2760662 RepID=A0A7W3Z8X9_9PSEU|nr:MULTISPECIES: ferredoxin [Amycolatopsis]MBB1152655.1 ferredoxin [Amycolatopsis dendrobii]UKD59798.1 ferredoxin [Amycolatopsis sp. FU40]